jgi:peptide chain release factor 2
MKQRLENIKSRFADILSGENLPIDRAELEKLDKDISGENFWKDRERAQGIVKKRAALKTKLDTFDKIQSEIEESFEFLQMATESNDSQLLSELEGKIAKLSDEVEKLAFRKMLGGPNDKNNAIVSINSGAGGTEAQDWVSILFRMYMRWCERKGYKVEVTDDLPGEEAGLKNVTFTVTGEFAFGYLSAENGIHRLVRISPFDANARRHTSFASVFVIPEIEDDVEIEIKDEDLKIDTYRAGGAGGQHVNKTDSAVRITHIPSGIVVQCQNERSQHKNKALAYKILRSKLYEKREKEKQAEMQKIHDEKKDIAWGSQIRSYVLQPYKLVKDHRTDIEIGNAERVLDGDLDQFIEAYLLTKIKN